MSNTYARLLPYEAEIWQEGFSWRGAPEELSDALAAVGAMRVTVPVVAEREARSVFHGIAEATPRLLSLRRLPPAAAIVGVAGLRRMAPPHCEGELLARAAQGRRRAVLLLLGAETVGWGLRSGRLQDAFRSLDEEAIGERTTGAVPTREAIERMLEQGDAFARQLFTASGVASGAGLSAYNHRLRQAVGRLAAALGGPPDGIWLGGDEERCRGAQAVLSDLAPVVQTGVAWGIEAWARVEEKG
ncbi:MAG: hypothetical protein M0Z66_10205 [Thermaerobacter sp.]|nr:hypothetical protein [Thermaerobacter sp.]